jgi:hypothetical protein
MMPPRERHNSARESQWLARHADRERALRMELAAHFVAQASRFAEAVESADVVTLALLPMIYRPADELERLLEAVQAPLLVTMGYGALDALEAAEQSDSADSEAGDESKLFGSSVLDLPFALPARVLDRIRRALGELLSQPFWEALEALTEAALTRIIGEGLERGANAEAIARQLRNELGGAAAMARARTIARTETTGALNAGQQANAEAAADAGLMVTKTWSTVGDDDVRASHEVLNGVTVPVGADFDVGGTLAPYPGHWSLPTEHRANCRCGFFVNAQ